MEVLTKAANILDISEYEVLSRAYAHWYGNPASNDVLKFTFSKYLKCQELPHWAKHYALKVIQAFESELEKDSEFVKLAWLLFFTPKYKNTKGYYLLA